VIWFDRRIQPPIGKDLNANRRIFDLSNHIPTEIYNALINVFACESNNTIVILAIDATYWWLPRRVRANWPRTYRYANERSGGAKIRHPMSSADLADPLNPFLVSRTRPRPAVILVLIAMLIVH